MPASSPKEGMFHRRLVLLVVLMLVGLSPLVLQLGRLTVVEGAALRAEAEGVLIAREWRPTSRGQILDRKGRVLAKDRPSFAVTVEYEIIAGGERWARTRAGRVARQHYRDTWSELTPEQRREKVDLYMAAFVAHLETMWDRLAMETGQTREQIEKRRQEVLRAVDRRYSAVMRSRLSQELEAQLALGREITTEVEDEVRKRATRDIEEQRAPHVIVGRVPDATAFEVQRLSDRRAMVTVPHPTLGSVEVDVPLLPGVRVEASGDREYPLDEMVVGVDLTTLPTPARGAGVREIRVEGVGYHVIGRMREGATKEDNDRRRERLKADAGFASRVMTPPGTEGVLEPVDRGEYQDGDWAGISGIEAAQEDELRGLRGLVVEQRETGERRELAAAGGRDVRLTIDAALQARVMAAMSPELGLAVAQQWQFPAGKENPTVPIGSSLNGAAVVLEIDTGEIVAMVSTPSISRRVLRESPDSIFMDPLNREVNVPWVDRAIARPYPPGSIVKALVINGAAKYAGFNLAQPISCTGHLFPDKPDMFRCWIFKQHNMTHDGYFGHAPTAEEAIMVSCNVYFFTLGQRLGPEGIAKTYRLFGLGEPLNIGLERPGQEFVEFPGYLGMDVEGRPATATSPGKISISDAIQMGIGQGPVAWTPLHAAEAYATLAQGGVRLKPTLIAGRGSPEPENLELDPMAVREAMAGLRLAVGDERGTGHHLTIADGVKEPHFNLPGVTIWGKTGTASAPALYAPAGVKSGDVLYRESMDPLVLGIQTDNPTLRTPQGRRVLRFGDHSWFVVLVGREGEERPRFAVSVMMEYAGSGGKVSGPIVNQILWALRAEGYL